MTPRRVPRPARPRDRRPRRPRAGAGAADGRAAAAAPARGRGRRRLPSSALRPSPVVVGASGWRRRSARDAGTRGTQVATGPPAPTADALDSCRHGNQSDDATAAVFGAGTPVVQGRSCAPTSRWCSRSSRPTARYWARVLDPPPQRGVRLRDERLRRPGRSPATPVRSGTPTSGLRLRVDEADLPALSRRWSSAGSTGSRARCRGALRPGRRPRRSRCGARTATSCSTCSAGARRRHLRLTEWGPWSDFDPVTTITYLDADRARPIAAEGPDAPARLAAADGPTRRLKGDGDLLRRR